MKVSDLMAAADKIFAKETGRKLAKLFRAQGLAPTFSQFCNEGIVTEELLKELADENEVHALHSSLDAMFKPLGFRVMQFDRHFAGDRLLGREKKVQLRQITGAFYKAIAKYTKELEQVKASGKPEDFIIKDFGRAQLNIVFSVKGPVINMRTIQTKDPHQFMTYNNGGIVLKV